MRSPSTVKSYFSRRLLKAINDWQVGSVGKRRKAKEIAKILTVEPLDSYYISCKEDCFRRTVLTPAAVKGIFFEFKIPEETSSWTTRIDVAAAFKGGPPELPRPGVIFRHHPKPSEVVLNISRLFEHEQFFPSVVFWESEGLDLSKGIRLWAGTQSEVVLTVESVSHSEIYAFGSNSAQTILDGTVEGVDIIGPTEFGITDITSAFADIGNPTKRWIFDEAANRAYLRWRQKATDRLGLR